jgi:hypothetical protein
MAHVIGKGMALHTDPLTEVIDPMKPLLRSRSWVIDIIDSNSV